MSIQKYFLILNLTIVVLISYQLARITSLIIEDKLNEITPKHVTRKRINIEPKKIKLPLSHYSKIAKKNIFTFLEKKIEIVHQQETIEEEPTFEPPKDPLKFKLVGTIMKDNKGYMAFLEDKSNRKQSIYRIGDQITPDAKIVRIDREYVTVDRGGSKELIKYPPFGKSKKSKRNKRRKKRRNRQTSTQKAKQPITKISDNKRIIEKRYFDEQIKNMRTLMTQARVVPSGKQGYKIFNISKGSLFEKMGVKNGDIIKQVNGIELSSPNKALEIYQQLQDSSEYSIDILRNGSLENLSYSIR